MAAMVVGEGQAQVRASEIKEEAGDVARAGLLM